MAAPIRMTRRVSFSSGHRYWLSSKSAEENRRLFGRWASPFNHGHNYVLDVTVEGSIDPTTGMVVNIKRIDDVLKSVIVSRFDGKSLNDEVDFFLTHTSCLENLIGYIADLLLQAGVMPEVARLTSLRLQEMPGFYADLEFIPAPAGQPLLGGHDGKNYMLTLTRTYEFAASHRLDSPALTPDQNLDVYGKCNNPAGHGHNYVLEVSVGGDPDPVTGMLLDLGDLDGAVEHLVVDRYDHKNLNVDIPEFQGKITTSEVVALEIFNRLKPALAGLTRIRLHETARNTFEVTAALDG